MCGLTERLSNVLDGKIRKPPLAVSRVLAVRRKDGPVSGPAATAICLPFEVMSNADAVRSYRS